LAGVFAQKKRDGSDECDGSDAKPLVNFLAEQTGTKWNSLNGRGFFGVVIERFEMAWGFGRLPVMNLKFSGSFSGISR
jgi:hypothetical protein